MMHRIEIHINGPLVLKARNWESASVNAPDYEAPWLIGCALAADGGQVRARLSTAALADIANYFPEHFQQVLDELPTVLQELEDAMQITSRRDTARITAEDLKVCFINESTTGVQLTEDDMVRVERMRKFHQKLMEIASEEK